jgi:hypothetical protein
MDRVEVTTAGDQGHVFPGVGEQTADDSTHRTRADDDPSHGRHV